MNEQENSHSQVSDPIVISHGSKHGGVKKFFKVLLLLLLLAGLGGLGYLYFVSSDQVSKLEAEKLNLNDQLAAKDKQIAELKGGDGGPGNSCGSGASYQAEVGKFDLTLDSPRVIVRKLDGAFEGGPATRLDVASCVEGEENVYDFPPQQEVSILANPNVSLADLKSAHESNYGSPTSTESVTIDGVSGNKYTYDGLFQSSSVFFEKDGVSYQIELSDTSDETTAALEDITGDWKFVAP